MYRFSFFKKTSRLVSSQFRALQIQHITGLLGIHRKAQGESIKALNWHVFFQESLILLCFHGLVASSSSVSFIRTVRHSLCGSIHSFITSLVSAASFSSHCVLSLCFCIVYLYAIGFDSHRRFSFSAPCKSDDRQVVQAHV